MAKDGKGHGSEPRHLKAGGHIIDKDFGPRGGYAVGYTGTWFKNKQDAIDHAKKYTKAYYDAVSAKQMRKPRET